MNARLESRILRIAVYAGALFSVAVLALVVGYVLIKGIPCLSPELFAWKYNSENVSLLPALINTILMTLLALALSVPLGIGSAIYLTEYARRGSKLVKLVRTTAETLSGIPSIIYGLFGSLFFVIALKLGLSLLSGTLTLSIMVLPLIMRTTEEALLAVPDSYREGSFGLGAGRLRTTFKVVLPSAVPGILSGVILAIGRIVGETARVDLHRRHSAGGGGKPFSFRAHPVGSYVRDFHGGLVSSTELRYRCGVAGGCDSH